MRLTSVYSLSKTNLHAYDSFGNGFVEDWQLGEPAEALQPLPGIEEPDYSRFGISSRTSTTHRHADMSPENWIPRFVRPKEPCDYCRSRRLNCYIQRGEAYCTPCATLFRECSLSNSKTLEATNYVAYNSGTFLDTLHVVDEDRAKERGTLTGIKELRSKAVGSGTATPNRDDEPGSSKRNGIRFPRHAVKALRDWLDAHSDNPYPTEEEKADLERRTELQPLQITNWLANARRRRKVTEKSRPKGCMSPSLRPTTAAIDIPASTEKPWDELNPFERWKHSPPEHEPASLRDIADAVARSDLPADPLSASPSTLGRSSKRRKGSSTGSGVSNRRAPSTGSADTGQTSSLSASSAALSKNSSHGSFSSFSSSLAGKKDRRRRRKPSAIPPGRKSMDDQKRIFQCTFCTDTFKSKYDWTRHEKSLHLSLEKWICAPHGPVTTDEATGDTHCKFCRLRNPSSEHLESHNYEQCADKGTDARTFYRKDHLRQHLRLMHGCEMTPAMDSWKFTAVNINSRCGFCAQRFTFWSERVDHLTAHFKAGARMAEWKGCRGLDPAVAAQVTNAMPPYLIGIESVSPVPFSATNKATWRTQTDFPNTIDAQLGPSLGTDLGPSLGFGQDGNGTCWEVLTVRLGQYANEMANQGVVITDEMLQRQARLILYDSDDTWNQTAADNFEWLDLFKKAHGLNYIPTVIGGQGGETPEDLETYGDLGLRIPFAVQLQAYNQMQTGSQRDAATRPGPYQQLESNKKELSAVMSKVGVLYTGEQKCDHPACARNLIDIIANAQVSEASTPTMRRWCSEELANALTHEVVDHQASGRNTHDLPSSDPSKTVDTLWKQGWSSDLVAARGRARGLAALSRVEAPETDNCPCPQKSPTPTSSGKYLPRHKYQLPQNKARLFATTTGAWEEAGKFPKAFETHPTIGEVTSTGAMMEFLGPTVGFSLPFSHDEATSQIPLLGADWQLPDGGTVTQEEMMGQISALVDASTAGEFVSGTTATEMDWTMDGAAPLEDMTFENLVFDDSFAPES